MTFKNMIRNSPLAGYGKAIREAPREVIFNPHLLLSSLIYAFGGFPVIWDQGASSVIPSLPGFQNHFKIISGSNADEIRVFVSIVYVGFGVGSALTFFVNDRIVRLWSYRLYTLIYCIGTLMAIFSPNLNVLYAARVIQGLGLGPLTVTCPMSIVEIAPAEIRGLLAAWFTLLMGLGLFTAVFCTLGVYRHVPVGNPQFQIVWLTPMILMGLCMITTFFIQESPRWLFMTQRRQEAIDTLVRIRGLPADNARVEHEIRDIEDDINSDPVSVHEQYGKRYSKGYIRWFIDEDTYNGPPASRPPPPRKFLVLFKGKGDKTPQRIVWREGIRGYQDKAGTPNTSIESWLAVEKFVKQWGDETLWATDDCDIAHEQIWVALVEHYGFPVLKEG